MAVSVTPAAADIESLALCGEKELKKLLARFSRNKTAPEADAEADEPAAKKEKFKGLSIPKLALVVAALLVLVVGVVAVLTHWRFEAVVAERAASANRAQASQVAAALAGRARGVADTVAAFASDPALAEAVLKQDQAAISGALALVRRAFPDALRVLVITPAQQDPDLNYTPLLGYACLDLARLAETNSELPPVEAHKAGTDEQHLDIVRAIRQNGTTVASLMVTLPIGALQGWVADASSGVEGYLELEQQAGNDGQRVVASGEARMKSGPSTKVAVPGTGFELTYWSPSQLAFDEVQVGLVIVFAGMAVAMIAILMLAFAWLARVLKQDLIKFVGHVVEVLGGERHHSLNMKLLEVQKAVRLMDESMHFERTPKPAGPLSAAIEEWSALEEELTDLDFVDQGAPAVDEEGKQTA